MGVAAIQALHPGPNVHDVIAYENEVLCGVFFRQVGSGNHVSGILDEEGSPLVQQSRFLAEEVLYFFAEGGGLAYRRISNTFS